MERVRIGDHDAYGVLVRRYSSIALRTAMALGAGAEAEDVVQESFVNAYRAFGRFRAGSEFRPWLLTIVGNQARNVHRSRGRRSERERRVLIDVPMDEAADPADTVVGRERRDQLHRELDRLAARYRDVLVCRFLLELTESETAQVLGLAPGTVKSRTSRGLRRLRDGLTAVSGSGPVGLPADEATTKEVRRGN